MMKAAAYVLITPARDEETTIGTTIGSVVSQSIRPKEWVIVSDGSTDRTDKIVEAYAAQYPFIRLLHLQHRPGRNFASVVFATEAGIGALKVRDYDFIGLLDADIKFGPRYYEEILLRFENEPKLGLAGGLVLDCHGGRRRQGLQFLGEVAGAVQFFRRECFESLGGLVALPEGGWDTITCLQARMNGYLTRTFPEIQVDHLKPRNSSAGNVFKRFWQFGARNYALGTHPLFEMAKFGYRCAEPPFLAGAFTQLASFVACYLSGRKRILSPEIVRYRRKEQMRRLFSLNCKGTSPSREARHEAIKGCS